MMGEPEYQPIDCDFHDRLEAYAITRRRVRITLSSGPGTAGREDVPDGRAEGRIEDIYTTDRKEEFLRMEDGITIRLDKIKTIDAMP